MNRKIVSVSSLFKAAAVQWSNDQAPVLGAALSYYTAFSLAPLLVLTIAIAGAIFGQEAARGEIVSSIQGLIGHDGAVAVQEMIKNARKPETTVLATVIGFVTLLVGASTVFAQLQNALNMIWRVAPRPGQTLRAFFRTRLLSFAMILVIGFLLLVSLSVSAALAALGHFFEQKLPGGPVFWLVTNFVVSFGVVTLLFAMIFKILPDARIQWSDVWTGSVVTAALFTIGKLLVGLYIGNSTIMSSYGAAGSLAVILIWVYYSAQILLFGAEFTQVYSRRHGHRIVPERGARLVLVNPMTHHAGRRSKIKDRR